MPAGFPPYRPAYALRGLQAVAFTPDGAVLWTLAERKLIRSERGRAAPRLLPAFPGARLLATSPAAVAIGGGARVGLLADDGAIRALRRPAGGRALFGLQWSPDGARLGAFALGQVDVFGADGAHLYRAQDPAFREGRVSFGPRGELCAFSRGRLLVFEARTGRRRAARPLAGMQAAQVLGMVCTREAVVLHYERPLPRSRSEFRVRFARADGTRLADLPTRGSRFTALCTSPDGARVAASGYEVMATLFDARGRGARRVRREVSNPPVALALTRPPTLLADATLNVSVLRLGKGLG